MKSRESGSQWGGGPLRFSPSHQRTEVAHKEKGRQTAPVVCKPHPHRGTWHSRATSAWQQAHSYLLAVNPQGPSVAKIAIKKPPKSITFQQALSLSCPLYLIKQFNLGRTAKIVNKRKANKQIKSSQILSQNKLLVSLHLFLCSFIITFLHQARYIQIKAISSFHA